MKLDTVAPSVAFEDTRKHAFNLPIAGRVTLIFYEDKDAGPQNEHTRRAVGQITDVHAGQCELQLIAIGDLEKWNWFPAHDYAIAAMTKVEEQEKITLFCDWTGSVRKAWKLTKGKSGIILLDAGGLVKFFGEGPLSQSQIAALRDALKDLGISH